MGLSLVSLVIIGYRFGCLGWAVSGKGGWRGGGGGGRHVADVALTLAQLKA